MTQVAFSHQFPQRWIHTPTEIKSALLQRLDDIIRLLDEDTDLDSFEFSIADLDAYLDDLYAQMAAKVADEQSQADQAAVEQSSIEQAEAISDQAAAFDVDIDEDINVNVDVDDVDKKSNNAESINNNKNIESEDIVEGKKGEDGKVNEEVVESKKVINSEKTDNNDIEMASNSIAEATSQQPVSTITSTPPAFAFKSTTDGKLDAEFIKDLERSIDDYLSEQLIAISEDLKAWLHDAISNHLSEQSKNNLK